LNIMLLDGSIIDSCAPFPLVDVAFAGPNAAPLAPPPRSQCLVVRLIRMRARLSPNDQAERDDRVRSKKGVAQIASKRELAYSKTIS
jgi:hypothetical protein